MTRYKNNQKYDIGNGYSVLYKDHYFYLLDRKDHFVFNYGFYKIYLIMFEYYHPSKIHGNQILLLMTEKKKVSIYDIINSKYLLEDFPCKSFKKVDDDIISTNYNDRGTRDIVIEFKDESNNIYNFSLEKGFTFGPIPYRKIKKYPFGYLVSKKILHYFNGEEEDLSILEEIETKNYSTVSVYKNKEFDSYYIFDTEEGLRPLEKCDNPNIRRYESFDKNGVFRYNFNIIDKTLTTEYEKDESHDICESYDLLADGFGGDAEAMSCVFID